MEQSDSDRLLLEAEKFGKRIDKTIDLVVEQNPGIAPRPLWSGGGFIVRLHEPLPLTQNGEKTMFMHLNFNCTWSQDSKYLAIEDSRIAIHKVDGGVPLVAFDYLRNPNSAPSAHINFSGMNNNFTSVLPKQYKSKDGNHTGLTGSKVHLPVGGHRFRPTLEDVFEMLINDFGIDHKKDTARRAIRDGRRDFRLGQVSAAATDAPRVAAEAIKGRQSDDERTERLEAF